MTHEPPPLSYHCPRCGADLGDPPAVRCASCGWWGDITGTATRTSIEHTFPEDANPYAPPRAPIGPRPTMHLGTLMLLIAVIAILIGVTVQEPVVGMVLCLVTVPALVRTTVAVDRLRARQPVSGMRVVGLFFNSLAVSGLTIFAAFLAFCVTCFPVGLVSMNANAAVGSVLAFVLGFVAAGYVVYLLARKIWPIVPRFDPRRDIVFLDDRGNPPPDREITPR